MTPTLKQLLHALALQRHRSFQKAAQTQNISQPAFSRSITSLETALGVQLFDRQSIGAVPTVFGEAILGHAETIAREAEELEREVHLLQGLETGTLSVALAVYPAELSGRRAVAELIAGYPDLRCKVQENDWQTVIDLVLGREAEIGLAEISVAAQDHRLEVDPVGSHELVLYCRSQHPLSGRTVVTDADLAEFPLALIRLPERLASVFPGKGEINPETGYFHPSIEIEDLSTAREIVLYSNAFSAATPMQIKPWLKRGELQVLPYSAPWLALNYGFIQLRGRMRSPAVEAFVNTVLRLEKDIGLRSQQLPEYART